MHDVILVLAAAGTIWERLFGFTMLSVFGALFLAAGIRNVKTQKAEESGRRRSVNEFLGASNTYEGKKAVLVGWIRIACGVGLMIAGVVFLFIGPALAEK